jgi:hypothetical protein
MRIPVIKGVIRRRLLVNFRADPAVVQRMLPSPFRPKKQGGHAVVGICLIRLEEIRPSGLPGLFGIASENAAHRVAVEWSGAAGSWNEGVYIPRRDTSSFLNRLVGGRFFPGEHHPAEFLVRDDGSHIELSMHSLDGSVRVRVVGDDAETLPATSCFCSVQEASAFFENGSLGYSATRDASRLDGLLLRTIGWKARALAVAEVESTYFSDEGRFPKGSVEFDHALVMRDVAHEWRAAEDLFTGHEAASSSSDPSDEPLALPGTQTVFER